LSEYQYIAFRAVDRPLTDDELAFAERQSTRAQITRWSFENEYHYGDFHGDAIGLLHHGYDAHLHYSSYGMRRIMLSLPAGLPFSKRVWSKYIGTGALAWEKDTNGKGGMLSLNPYRESGELEETYEPGSYMEDVVEIRNRLVEGDLRALYLLWLCAIDDDQADSPDIIEPPVPAGLAEFFETSQAILDFFGLDPLMLVAAAEGAQADPPQHNREQQYATWVEELSESESKLLLRRLLSEDATTVKSQMLSDIRNSGASVDWPTVALRRSIGDLLDRTETLRAEHNAEERRKHEAAIRCKAAEKQRKREERMVEMLKDPEKWLRETEKLAEDRGTDNYELAAEILFDLREAVGGDKGKQITHKHAAHLTKKHPTLSRLKSSLRKRGLLE